MFAVLFCIFNSVLSQEDPREVLLSVESSVYDAPLELLESLPSGSISERPTYDLVEVSPSVYEPVRRHPNEEPLRYTPTQYSPPPTPFVAYPVRKNYETSAKLSYPPSTEKYAYSPPAQYDPRVTEPQALARRPAYILTNPTYSKSDLPQRSPATEEDAYKYIPIPQPAVEVLPSQYQSPAQYTSPQRVQSLPPSASYQQPAQYIPRPQSYQAVPPATYRPPEPTPIPPHRYEVTSSVRYDPPASYKPPETQPGQYPSPPPAPYKPYASRAESSQGHQESQSRPQPKEDYSSSRPLLPKYELSLDPIKPYEPKRIRSNTAYTPQASYPQVNYPQPSYATSSPIPSPEEPRPTKPYRPLYELRPLEYKRPNPPISSPNALPTQSSYSYPKREEPSYPNPSQSYPSSGYSTPSTNLIRYRPPSTPEVTEESPKPYQPPSIPYSPPVSYRPDYESHYQPPPPTDSPRYSPRPESVYPAPPPLPAQHRMKVYPPPQPYISPKKYSDSPSSPSYRSPYNSYNRNTMPYKSS